MNMIIFFVLALITAVFSNDLYNIKLVDINGQEVTLEQYKGKVLLIANVASLCGYTDAHYRQLVSLQAEYMHTDKFTVLGFPCNQFGNQEPENEAAILKFASDKYGVNFPLFAKTEVKGDSMHAFWKALEETSGHSPSWNFWKYLIGHDGQVIGFWGPWTSVEEISSDVQRAVVAAMAADGKVGEDAHPWRQESTSQNDEL